MQDTFSKPKAPLNRNEQLAYDRLTENLSASLRRILADRKLSQEKVAYSASLSSTCYADIELKRSNVTIKTLAQIATALGTDVITLLTPLHLAGEA